MAATLSGRLKEFRVFATSISIFVFFYYVLALLTLRWPEYLGPLYAKYAGIFANYWIFLTTAVVIWLIMVVVSRQEPQKVIERTAIVLNLWEAIGGLLAVVAGFCVVFLAFYLTGTPFPWDSGTVLFLLPVLAIAAVAETLIWQWYLARAFTAHWKFGWFWAQVMFALAHPGLTIVSFVALVMLGLLFYYMTNPSRNLPSFVNVVSASGAHVFYNVFVLAYGGGTGFVMAGPGSGQSVLFWGVVALVVILWAVGEYGSRRRLWDRGA